VNIMSWTQDEIIVGFDEVQMCYSKMK